MSIKGRLAKVEKALPQPQGISLAAMMAAVQRAEDEGTPAAAAARDALSKQFLAQFGIEPSAEVVPDKIERELERLIAEATRRRRLPNGLKLLPDESTEVTTDDGQPDSCS
jgi:hypothetical protein